MSVLGNILWFFIVGWWSWLGWMFSGLIYCITIIGIPLGLQCFKFAKLSLFPFGKEVEYSQSDFHLLVNIIWILLPGLEMAFGYLMIGIILCLTIIGIPFGLQCFKMAKLSLMPFGAKIR